MSEIADAAVGTSAQPIFGRKLNLIVRNDAKGLDLSQFRVRFKTSQTDGETPNTAVIRVYNLARETVARVRGEFDQVVLQAGYEKGQFGTIFAGSLKQFHIGRESNVDSFLDLLCADGDIGYNFGVIAATLAAGSSMSDAIDKAAESMGLAPPDFDVAFGPGQDPKSIRGKVLFGMGRDMLRDSARSMDASWTIEDGNIVLRPLNKPLPGEAVVLNSASGMIGIPELTDDGVDVRMLLNPLVRVGRLVHINQEQINRTVQQSPGDIRRFDSFTEPATLAAINADGFYVVLVAEHEGDSRGPSWTTSLTCMAAQSDTGEIKVYGP